MRYSRLLRSAASWRPTHTVTGRVHRTPRCLTIDVDGEPIVDTDSDLEVGMARASERPILTFNRVMTAESRRSPGRWSCP